MRRLHVALSVATALAVLVVPTGAAAKPGYKVHPAGVRLVLPVAKVRGHFISLIADGRQRVQLTIELPAGTVEYSTGGYVSGRRIVADFGALGRIDVRLRFGRSGSDPAHRGHCKGRGSRHQEGTYRGTIEFSRGAGVPRGRRGIAAACAVLAPA